VKPEVDLIVLVRDARPLHPEVERGIRLQREVQLRVHRVCGKSLPDDRCRWDAIARGRNEGKLRGTAPWVMFLDDDVVLGPQCISSLVGEIAKRPAYGALGADYLGQARPGRVAPHVSMGATVFRREALEQVHFAWREKRCECQVCCDELRRYFWAIDYYSAARARHLPKAKIRNSLGTSSTSRQTSHHGAIDLRLDCGTATLPSVCLVACYMGPPPGWINHYLMSCAYNPSIDFLIVTDQNNFPEVPKNVRVKRMSISSFKELVQEKIGVKVGLSHPRKMCDFKPAYGHLFEEDLKGWDYWGYTDIDIIYGDIRRFLCVAMLQKYDVYTARKEFLVGHFSLFRNNAYMKTLYQKGGDYQNTLRARSMLSFSECGRQWRQRLQGKPLTDDAACDSMMHIVFREMASGKISASFSRAAIEWPDLAKRGWRLRWHAGRLWSIDHRREAMYFHFNAFRGRAGYRAPGKLEGAPALEMTANGIKSLSGSRKWSEATNRDSETTPK
jgi:hypothetical protein